MKAREKPSGTGRRISEEKLRRQRFIVVVFMIAMASVSGFAAFSILDKPSATQAVSFKAAIVDQLSGTSPNGSFTNDTKSILASAGYSVDYYSPDGVTVDFFRSLPSKGYGLVILRAHSTGWITGNPVAIFTSELWRSDRYVSEQLTGSVGEANLYPLLPWNQGYFVISSRFVRYSMQGSFPNSIIIMMGCTGLKDSEMAQAFVARGASVYISWDKSVTADRTDASTITLLRSLAIGKTVREAVDATMKLVGPDPAFGSHLAYYPEDQGGLALSLHNSQNQMLSVEIRLELCLPGESRSFAN